MQRTITLNQVLSLWHTDLKKRIPKGGHVSDFELVNIAQGGKSGSKEILHHLLLCDDCLQKFKEATPGEKQNFAELAWKKAAATETTSWPQFLYSDNGVFKIEIRESEVTFNTGLISVEAEKNAEQLEGREISVIDGKSRTLLKGIIKKGQVFQKIENLSNIDLRLLVRTLD
jgi:hypothetical protein